MKIAIYHPNLHLYGGGETVCLTLASNLSKEHNVTIYSSKKTDKKELEKYFGLKLTKVKIKPTATWANKLRITPTIIPSLHLKLTYKHFKEFDYVIDTCSNGLFFKKITPKTIAYVHFPNFYTQRKGYKKILNKIIIKKEEMFVYDKIIANSNFTKEQIGKLTNKQVEIVYPPVKIRNIKPKKNKKNQIITIGRYTKQKKLEIMIHNFKKIAKKIPDYKLIIIGSLPEKDKEGKKYYEELRKQSKKEKITLLTNVPHKKTLNYLEESKIYWHARGFEEENPEEYENFGITTAEAMAAGCIPVAIGLGAQPEIVQHRKSGFIWNNEKELRKYTIQIATKNKETEKAIKIMQENAKNKTKEFDKKIFLNQMRKILFKD